MPDGQVEPEGTSELPAASKALFLDKVRQSNAACQSGDYATAVSLYTDALQLDPSNHILYSNRSAALVKMGQFAQALQDAIRARELNSKWPKVREHKPLWMWAQKFAFSFSRLM
jgi:Flp pilus assembly protein TadD